MLALLELNNHRSNVLVKYEHLLSSQANSTERDWQNLFEENPWILGYGLNYTFNAPLDSKKLETVISSGNFKDRGKRVDALMKSRGAINTLCFVEIKTNTTPLLSSHEYRNDCWGISNEMSGAISQVLNYKYHLSQQIEMKIDMLSPDGFESGECVFNVNPRGIIIIGSLNEFRRGASIHQKKWLSFEMFRKSLNGIELLTFDELYERARAIVYGE